MELSVKGKNLEVSDAIRSYAERKLGKLDKHVNKQARVELELAMEKNPSIADNQVAEATLWLKGHTLRAREATRDMKASIDELSAKLLRQVKEERKRKAAMRKIDKHALDAEAAGPAEAALALPNEGGPPASPGGR